VISGCPPGSFISPRIELRTRAVHRLAAGRIIETSHLEDFAGLRRQLTAAS
jgi:hypothetical protein